MPKKQEGKVAIVTGGSPLCPGGRQGRDHGPKA